MVKNNTIYLGSDHAGFQLKEEIKNYQKTGGRVCGGF